MLVGDLSDNDSLSDMVTSNKLCGCRVTIGLKFGILFEILKHV